MNIKSLYFLLSLIIIGCSTSEYPNGESKYNNLNPDGVPFVVNEFAWEADLHGNHRIVVEVADETKAAEASVMWRRPDLRIDTKDVLVKSASGDSIKFVSVNNFTRESADIIFEPIKGEKLYYIYYLPYNYRRGWGDARYGKPWNHYFPYKKQDNPEWLKRISDPSNVAQATVLRFESRSRMDFFTSMGLSATSQESENIKQANNNHPIVFIEDRAYPIKLRHNLPVKWVTSACFNDFKGMAAPNEYYTWQFGVWAADKDVQNIKLEFSDFKNGSNTIKSSEFTCFNQEGKGWDGKDLEFTINVPKGQIQALWAGVQIPRDAKKGKYNGVVTLTQDNGVAQEFNIEILVDGDILEHKGDNDLWRHSRLRWLNSQIGVDSLPLKPYPAMAIGTNKIEVNGKSIQLSENGLIKNVTINGKDLFVKPMNFIVTTDKGKIEFGASDLKLNKIADGLVELSSSYSKQGIDFKCSAKVEYDGYIRYNILVSSNSTVSVKDISLVSDYTKYSSKYMIGAGYKGGLLPNNYKWDWTGPYDSFWMGNDIIGAHIEYRGGAYHGPLIQDYKPAPSPVWSNDGKGEVKFLTKSSSTQVIASTGSRTIDSKGLDFEFSILLTPVKELDTKSHFQARYYHSSTEGFAKAGEESANIINIHHSRSLNPVINYPFIVTDSLVSYIQEQHKHNRKVKLYYTIRELTNYTEEIHALMSLNGEIFREGVGYGTPWHTEHLIDGYRAAWYTELPNQTADAALVLSGFSRWINYYLEGLRWMLENYKIDGIYMDDVSFDRNVMKRMKKIMVEYRDGAVIDLHSNTWYSVGPMNQYADFMPYVDRLWFGESFKYNEMNPDEWFATFAGIPMGQMSEMLQDGGNPYLGMVYGTTGRHTYHKCDPGPMWKFWDEFGITDSKMVGYWSEDAAIKTNSSLVKATAFIKDGKVAISVGNFSDKTVKTKLDIDWKKIGLDPKSVKITTPEIERFQTAKEYEINSTIPIEAKKGVMLLIEQK